MAENIENNGYSQRDNAEHEGYVVWRGLTIENNRKDNNLHIK